MLAPHNCTALPSPFNNLVCLGSSGCWSAGYQASEPWQVTLRLAVSLQRGVRSAGKVVDWTSLMSLGFVDSVNSLIFSGCEPHHPQNQMKTGAWRDNGSKVMSTYCSCGGPEFSSQLPMQGCSQLHVIPVLGRSFFWPFVGTRLHVHPTHVSIIKNKIFKNQIFEKGYQMVAKVIST